VASVVVACARVSVVSAFVFRFNGFSLRLSVKGKRANHKRLARSVNSWSKSGAGRLTRLPVRGRPQSKEAATIFPPEP